MSGARDSRHTRSAHVGKRTSRKELAGRIINPRPAERNLMADDGLSPITTTVTTDSPRCCPPEDKKFQCPSDKGNDDSKREENVVMAKIQLGDGTEKEIKGTRVYVPFDVEIDFSDQGACKCACCEYRQRIRGSYKKKIDGTWREIKMRLPDGEISATEFKEDGIPDRDGKGQHFRPGRHDTKDPNEKYTQKGCHYKAHDEPSLTGSPGTPYAVDLEFAGEVVDICNNDPKTGKPTVLARKTWKVKFSGTF
jgi:hypothetical protein